MKSVLLARHFQHRVESYYVLKLQSYYVFIFVHGPLGKVKYHAIKVQFQVRGNPHIHSLLWILDTPV